MSTMTIQIGNSDNKLTQEMWANYHADVNDLLSPDAYIPGVLEVHFHGASSAYEKWQNICWVVNVNDAKTGDFILKQLTAIRKAFNQDSIAVVYGPVLFL